MNDKNELAKRREMMAEKAMEIDRIAAEANVALYAAKSFVQEIQIAQAMVDLRRLLTDDMMAPIMALQNTNIGFRTDRDPSVTPRDKDGKEMQPYPLSVVRDCTIEAMMRGFRMIGNESNIIAGKWYGAKNGFFRKIKEFPNLSNFSDSYDPPQLSPDGKTATVKARASWVLNGEKKTIGVEPNDPFVVVVRVNSFMGPDAIKGKAERKLWKAVHDRLLGTVTPDAEPEDVLDVVARRVDEPKASFAKPQNTNQQPCEPEKGQ